MMDNLHFETLSLLENSLEFTYGIFPPEHTLAKGVILLIAKGGKNCEDYSSALNFYIQSGFIGAVISLTNKTFTEEAQIFGCRALIDKIRATYKFLPIIVCGEEISSISARDLAIVESDRIGGVVLSEPSIKIPSGFDLIKAKILTAIKGNEFISPILGDYGIPLVAVISYISKAKELDTPEKIEEYPKHIPTLIINATDDTLFERLDDAYVSELKKARCNSPEELQGSVVSFAEGVIEGVNDALSSSSFIYRGNDI